MPPCHTTPFLKPGILIAPPHPQSAEAHAHETAPAEACDYCGSVRLEWRKCKLICAECRQINKSCADL